MRNSSCIDFWETTNSLTEEQSGSAKEKGSALRPKGENLVRIGKLKIIDFIYRGKR